MSAWHCDPPSWKSYFLVLVAEALLQELASGPSLEVNQDENVSLDLSNNLQFLRGMTAGGVRGCASEPQGSLHQDWTASVAEEERIGM